MTRLQDKKTIKIESLTSPFTFESKGGGSWDVWDRFIAFNGQNIYHIGNICGTCSFFFEQLKDNKKSINSKETIDKLNDGLTSIEDDTIDILKEIIPIGVYEIALLTITPKFTVVGQKDDYFSNEQVDSWGIDGYLGVPHSPKVNYYRGKDKVIGERRKIFEFFIPFSSTDNLDQSRVSFYKEEILNGNKPTAISLSILDIKESTDWPYDDIKPKFNSHWCIAHYIVDGHHKIKAASDLNSEITLLSFIATEKGVSSKEEIYELLNFM